MMLNPVVVHSDGEWNPSALFQPVPGTGTETFVVRPDKDLAEMYDIFHAVIGGIGRRASDGKWAVAAYRDRTAFFERGGEGAFLDDVDSPRDAVLLLLRHWWGGEEPMCICELCVPPRTAHAPVAVRRRKAGAR